MNLERATDGCPIIDLSEEDIDLMLNALDLWEYRLSEKVNEPHGQGHWYAAAFTKRRIEKLKEKLKALQTA